MRKKLAKIDGVRKRFSGTFERYGVKTNWHGFPDKTILLLNVKDEKGVVVTDHLWFNFTKSFEALGDLKGGEVVAFDGRVTLYEKGYVDMREYIDMREIDYKISRPTKVELIG